MKSLFTLLFLLTLSVNANTIDSIYNSGSQLNNSLKVEIADALTTKFSCINSYGINEVSTEVVVDEVDQGIVDYYYITTFSVAYTYDYHPNEATVVVKSVKYAGSNPTIKWTHIESIEGHILCD